MRSYPPGSYAHLPGNRYRKPRPARVNSSHSSVWEIVHDALIGLDANLVIRQWNQAAEVLFGWAAREVIGRPAGEVIRIDLSDAEASQRIETLRHQGRVSFQASIYDREGRPRAVEVKAARLKQPDGGPVRYAAALREVAPLVFAPQKTTDQQTLFNTLASAKAQLEALIAHLPTGVIVSDAEGQILLTNQAAQALLNGPLKGDAFHPRGAFTLHRLDGTPFPEAELPLPLALRSGELSAAVEIVVRHDSGSEVYLQASAAPYYDPQGRYAGAVAVLQDFTQRRRDDIERARILAALQASEERFRSAVLAAPFPIMIHDAQGQVMAVNAAWTASSGYPAEALPSLAAWSEKSGGILHQLLPSEQTAEGEMRVITGSGAERTWDFYTAPLGIDSQGKTLVIRMAVDVTHRKQAEQAIRETNQKLERSNRELEEFALVASHDLQEPLRKIRQFSKSVQNQLRQKQYANVNESLQRMERSAERMQAMINGLLELSRIHTSSSGFELVDLSHVMEEVISDLEPRIQASGGDVMCEPLPVIEADPLQIRLLLQNLIGNSLKFHTPGSAPQVHVYSQFDLSSARREPSLTIVVEDQGIGFEAQYAERIFQPFQRLHGRSEYEGTGMGLAICSKIVERHQGSIEVASQPGQGTAFFITLPIKHR